ncbi:MAG TPA: NUDIX domain-containing protein [Polyangiaceae bacterium]|nr:NUDIX domain-containing protein [Polyangiaceae bacterium]
MPNVSAGLLMFRRAEQGLEAFLAHPGGPFFRNKDAGAWTLPKGLHTPEETLLETARREFHEEIGLPVTEPLLPLGEVRQRSGKIVHAWAFEGSAPIDFVPASNTFELEWPPRSGKLQLFPEVDRARFFSLAEARIKMIAAQTAFLDRLVALLTH